MRNYDTIADPTQNDLGAALLDQNVAGQFQGKDYAFVPITADKAGFGVGVAIANEPGYHPVVGFNFDSYREAADFADGMNKHIGLPQDHAVQIVCSTMGGRTYYR